MDAAPHDDIEEAALLWRITTSEVRGLHTSHPEWSFNRYEDIVNDPAERYRELFEIPELAVPDQDPRSDRGIDGSERRRLEAPPLRSGDAVASCQSGGPSTWPVPVGGLVMEPSSSRRPIAEWLIPSDRSIAAWYDRVHRSLRKHVRVSSLLSLGVIAFAAVAAAVYGSGGLDLETAGNSLASAAAGPGRRAARLAGARPGGATSRVVERKHHRPHDPLALRTDRSRGPERKRCTLGLGSGLLPVVLLLAMSYLFPADVGDTAAIARDNFLKYLALLPDGRHAVLQPRPGRTADRAPARGGLGDRRSRDRRRVARQRSDLPACENERTLEQDSAGRPSALRLSVRDGIHRQPRVDPSRLGSIEGRTDGSVGLATGFFAITTALSFVRGAWLAALIGDLLRRAANWEAPVSLVGSDRRSR